MDLWPCSTKDLDHLSRQEWLFRGVNKKIENPTPVNGPSSTDRTTPDIPINSNVSGKVIYPDVSRMVVYAPGQKPGITTPVVPGVSSALPNGISGGAATIKDTLKSLPPTLAVFVSNLPVVEGPSPDVDFVISICLQSNIPPASAKPSAPQQLPSGSDISGSTKLRQTGKRKGTERQDDDDASTIQSQPLPKDAFKIRQLQKALATSSRTGGASSRTGGTSSRTGGSASYGSGFSGDFSGSSG
ncbi:cleavage stimulation factor subunit 77-like [Salvia divinorum]|uniref:Cleavage stimulation factor subunit 77-like n=1 Tax=Salvia divinorum TaxID=28513 RepID=A0ABD1GJI0_SALDI